MRLTLNDGHVIPLSATQCHCPLDVCAKLGKYVKPGSARLLLVDFAGEYIPVRTDDELRIVSMLACAYHNQLVRANVQDPTYEPYKPPPETGAWQTQKSKWRVRRVQASEPEPPQPPQPPPPPPPQPQAEWDEELLGERVVFDQSFEMNEDLVPWKQERRNDWNIERWGLYA